MDALGWPMYVVMNGKTENLYMIFQMLLNLHLFFFLCAHFHKYKLVSESK